MSGNLNPMERIVEKMNHWIKVSLLCFQTNNTLIRQKQFIINGVTFNGIYRRKMFEIWNKLSSKLQNCIDLLQVITNHFHIGRFQQCFDEINSNPWAKGMLVWDSLLIPTYSKKNRDPFRKSSYS